MPIDHSRLLPIAEKHYRSFCDDLETLTNIDCGSYDAVGVNLVAQWVTERLKRQGINSERIVSESIAGGRYDGTPIGDSVVGRLRGDNASGARILLMAHMDTVFEPGEPQRRPFSVAGQIARGPGVCDDKAGLLTGLYALAVLAELDYRDFAEIVLHCSPDEEIGSPASRQVIETLADGVDAAICLECARANGDLVSARKGIADLQIQIRGRAAHAGIEPEKGINAAVEAAHLILALQELNGRWPTVTCNVGLLRGGSRPNIVCDLVELEVDLRCANTTGFAAAYAQIERLCQQPTVPGIEVQLRRTAEHVPWERNAGTADLVSKASRVGESVGVIVQEAATGGAADANTTAALGVPTIDGLGPVGGDDHAPTEWLDLSTITSRVALLAGLLTEIERSHA